MDEQQRINLTNWEARVPLHADSDEYGLARYVTDPTHLSPVVRADVSDLGELTDLDVVHLQCHLGTDTLSLARLGARVTGVDFSPTALAVARDLAAQAGPDVTYVEAAVEQVPDRLAATFDLVYTGVGALCWLPSVARWAEVVAALLRPGGRLFIREGHPVLWALDDPRPDGLVALEYPYFEGPGVAFHEDVSYVSEGGSLAAPATVQFNHGLGEIITALQRVDMEFEALEEHDSVPWTALGDQMVDVGGGEFRLVDRPERLPHSYTLQARRR